MYKVFQIVISQAEANAINAGVERAMEKFNAYSDASILGKVEDSHFFEHVANVDVDEVEEVFVVMNRWDEDDEEKVERLAPLHSLSVGDVVVDDQGNAQVVAMFGFEEINVKFAA